jgi:hypothetical protein
MTQPRDDGRDPDRRARLAAAATLPTLSGRQSAWVLLACLGLAAALVLPFAPDLPFWLRVEVVLSLWWTTWTGLMTYLLHRGARLSDDHEPSDRLRAWLGGAGERMEDAPEEAWSGSLVYFTNIVLVLLLLWFFVAFALPLLAFSAYLLVRGALVHVVHDRHDCRGDWGRSLAWAALWATIYIAPLAGLVAVVHAIRSGSGVPAA